MEARQAMQPVFRSLYPAQENMVGPKRKDPIQGPDSPAGKKSTQNMFRLCIRCKAKMTEEDWDALLANTPGEAKRWFASIDLSTCADHRAHLPNSRSADKFNKQSSREEDKKEKRDSLIQRALRESYGRKRPVLTPISREGPRAPQQQQDPLRGYQESRGQGAPQKPFSQQAERGPAHGPSQRPERIEPHWRLGPLGALRGPIGHWWRGPTLRPPHRGTPGAG